MKRLLTSCFGLGWLPLAPGTWGSLPPAIIFGLICQVGVSAIVLTIVFAILILIGSAVCVQLAPSAIDVTGKKDPGEVVADEFAGQSVAFLAGPFLGPADMTLTQIWLTAAAGFILFRIFDIFKPWPIRKLEKFPMGWGILADDLLAGLFAGIFLLVVVRFGIARIGA